MEQKIRRLRMGSSVIRSTLLFVLGLLCIVLGLSLFPVIGILAGAVLVAFSIYPFLDLLHRNRVNILIGAVTDNYLESMRIPVAILSATRERDGFDFDPRRLDPTSAVFGPLRARPVENMSDSRIYTQNLVDVNDDGVPDLILYFAGDTAGISAKDKKACLRAKTRDGKRLYGCAEVNYEHGKGLNERLEYV